MSRTKTTSIAATASRPTPGRSSRRAGTPAVVTTMDGAVLRALSLTAPGKKPAPSKAEVRRRVDRTVAEYGHLLGEDIVRFRPKGGGDRRIKVEYLADPQHPGSVLVRLTPSSTAALPPVQAAPDLLSTQEAADELRVSRPYLVKLVEEGKFEGVVRTASGHRRIPRAEVDRVHAQMRAERRAALDEMYALSSEQARRELKAVRENPPRRWVKKKPG